MRQPAWTGNRHLRPVLAGVFRNLRSPVMESSESQKDGLAKAQPRVRQAHPDSGAPEQPCRELVLRASNESADRRLRGAELPRRMGEAAVPHRALEGDQGAHGGKPVRTAIAQQRASILPMSGWIVPFTIAGTRTLDDGCASKALRIVLASPSPMSKYGPARSSGCPHGCLIGRPATA